MPSPEPLGRPAILRLPSKKAPSCMINVPALISPVTRPLGRISTRPAQKIWPLICPATVTDSAVTLAVTLADFSTQMVRLLSISPCTVPQTRIEFSDLNVPSTVVCSPMVLSTSSSSVSTAGARLAERGATPTSVDG